MSGTPGTSLNVCSSSGSWVATNSLTTGKPWRVGSDHKINHFWEMLVTNHYMFGQFVREKQNKVARWNNFGFSMFFSWSGVSRFPCQKYGDHPVGPIASHGRGGLRSFCWPICCAMHLEATMGSSWPHFRR